MVLTTIVIYGPYMAIIVITPSSNLKIRQRPGFHTHPGGSPSSWSLSKPGGPGIWKNGVQCEAPKIAKLVQIPPKTMVYGTYNYSYWGLQTNLQLGGLTLYM